MRTLPIKEWLEYFVEIEDKSKVIVKCQLFSDEVLKFSKVYRGDEHKGENAEVQLVKDLRVFCNDDRLKIKEHLHIQILTNRSPSMIGSEQMSQLYRQLKTRKIKSNPTFSVSFAHPGHYTNQRAILNLHRSDIKLSILTIERILEEAAEDCIKNIRSLEDKKMMETRRCRIDVDELMLKTAHYLILSSFMINQRSLVERINDEDPSKDVYVQNQKRRLKKNLRSNSRNRALKMKIDLPEIGMKEEDVVKEEVMEDKVSEILKMKNKREGSGRSVSLPFHLYISLFLKSKNINKGLKMRSIDGKWEIVCRNKIKDIIFEDSGYTYKMGSMEDTISGGLGGITDSISQLEKIVLKEDNLEIKARLMVSSLPDKIYSLKHFVDNLSKVGKVMKGRADVEISVSRVDAHNIPAQEILIKSLTPASTESCRITKKISVMQIKEVINGIIDDIETSLFAFQTFVDERKLKIEVKKEKLSAAIHLMRSSIRISDDGRLQRLVDMDSFEDSAYRVNTEHLREILKSNIKVGKKKEI